MKNLKNIKNVITLDIETTGLFPWTGDKVTCICAKHDSNGDYFKHADRFERNLLDNFFTWLYKYEPTQTILVTANGRFFDLPFLQTRWHLNNIKNERDHHLYLNKYNHFDVDNDIVKKRISLDTLATIYNIRNKTANGLQAIQWYKEGRLDLIEEYCFNDVLITEQVYQKYLELTENKK